MRGALRAGLLALAIIATAPAAPAAELTERQRLDDFDTLWRSIDQGYAYSDGTRATWRRSRGAWRARAARSHSRAEFVQALEGAVAQLHDDHVTLSERGPASLRRVPSETDIWAAWRDDEAVIEAVRTYAGADVAGLHPGHRVTGIAGLAPHLAVRDLLGPNPTKPARDWALRHALAGPRGGTLRVEVAEAPGTRTLEIERRPPATPNGQPLLARRIGEGRDLGYVRIKAPLSDPALPARFAEAIDYLRGTRAMILDLRDTAGPFEDGARARTATTAILRRFAPRQAAWQAREPRGGERVVDSIPGSATAYAAPLVVLVDRWTAGEGEALAAGLQAVARARLIGTPMAGLRGELGEVRLAHSGIVLRYPAQKAFHVDGRPRESLQPDIAVDLAAPQGGPGDPILYQALKLLEK